MKMVFALLCTMMALSANAQPPERMSSLQSELNARLARELAVASIGEKPNEIVSGKVNYSGIAVEVIKTGQPLQLINPAAPAKYGSPEDNILRSPISGRVVGWKLFSIGF